MMIKQLKKHGNGKAITIEKPLLDLLGIDDETFLEVTTDGVSLTLTPVKDQDKQRDKFETNLKDINTRYAEAFEKMPKD